MSKNKMQRAYVSRIDQFLIKFDQEHPELSVSQKREIEKFRRIYRLRDDAHPEGSNNKIPDDF